MITIRPLTTVLLAVSAVLCGCSSPASASPPVVSSIAVPPPDAPGPEVVVTGEITEPAGHPGCALLRIGTQTWRLTGLPVRGLSGTGRARTTRLTVQGHAARATGTTTVCGPFPAFVVTSTTRDTPTGTT